MFNYYILYVAEMEPFKIYLPVNHWMKQGENVLMMMLAPIDEQGNFGKFPREMRCTMTLKVRKSGANPGKDISIAILKFTGKDPTGIKINTPERRLDSKRGFISTKDGDVIIGKVKKESFQEIGVAVSRSIALPEINLPEWKFLKSDNITGLSGIDIEGRLDEESFNKLKNELLPTYRKIWSALESRKLDEILQMFDERNREVDAAFYKEPGETAVKLSNEFKEKISDSNLKLWSITDDNVMVQLYDTNKLVRLLQNNRNPLISFDDVKNKIAYHYDIIFRKSGDKWVIMR